MTQKEAELLIAIGKKPFLDKDDLRDKLGGSIRQYLYNQRERGRVIKTMLEEDREKGLRWELTGKGKRDLKSFLDELEERLGVVNTDLGGLHVYRPKHTR